MIMDKDLIKTVAQEIINESIINNYQMYLLIIAISLLSAIVSSFITSYFKKRGENLATKADFDDIVSQLKLTTKASEEVKAEISRELQEQLGHKVLLREKLEAIFNETFELELWLERSRSGALRKQLPDLNESPITKIEMYQAIYFPEASSELQSLQKAYYPMTTFIIGIAKDTLNEREPKTEEFSVHQPPLMIAISNFRDALIEKYSYKAGL